MGFRDSDAEELSGRKNRRLKHLMLDRRFQLKYMAMVLGVAAAICVVLGVFLYAKVRENSRMLALEALADAAFQRQLDAQDTQVLLTIGGSFLVFLIALGALSLLVTHRMAGPIYVMSRHVRALAKGRIPEVRRLRKGDEFVDFYEALARAVGAIQKRTESEIEIMGRAMAALERVEGEEAEAIRKELGGLVDEKRAMLEAPPS